MLFIYLFGTSLETEMPVNARIFTIPALSGLAIPAYALLYSKLSVLSPSVLGNIYIPFHGYEHVDIGRYFLICAAAGAWLAVFFITAFRFIMSFYRNHENMRETKKRKIIFWFAFIFYILTTSFVTLIYPPTGDEPHYLITARSIASDLDVDLGNNYADEAQHARFFPGVLDYAGTLHTVRSKHGTALYTTHDMGLPFLITPFVKIGGRYAVQFFINFTAALLCLALYIMLARLGITARLSAAAAMTAAICMPIMAGSSLVLTEVPAAFIVSYSIYILAGTEKRGLSLLFFSLISFLPWLHLKLIIFPVVFYVYYYYLAFKNKNFSLRAELINNIPVLLSAVLYVWFYYAVYGIIAPFGVKELHENIFMADPSKQMNTFMLDPLHVIISGLAVIFDRDYGLITYCPLYVLSIWGLMAAFYQKNLLAFFPLLLAVPYILLFLVWKDWTGSMTPARQLLPIIPVFIYYAAYFLESADFIKTGFFKILAAASFFISWLLAVVPPLRYGASKFKIYDFISRHAPRRITWLLPPFCDNTTAGLVIASVYLAAIITAYYFYVSKGKIRA